MRRVDIGHRARRTLFSAGVWATMALAGSRRHARGRVDIPEALTRIVDPHRGADSDRSSALLTLRAARPNSRGQLGLEYSAPDGRVVAARWLGGPKAVRRALAEIRETGAPRPYVVRSPIGLVLVYRWGTDPRLPGLGKQLERTGARLVGHRVGHAAVVRIESGSRVVYAKVFHPSRTAAAAGALEEAARVAGGRFDTPRVESRDDREGVIVLGELPGTPLWETIGSSTGDAAVIALARALRAFHQGDGAGNLRPRAHDREAVALRRSTDVIRSYVPVNGRLRDLAAAIADRLAAIPGPVAPIHGDLHGTNVVVGERERLGVLDFDGFARGDPALDVGGFGARLLSQAVLGGESRAASASAATSFIDAYEPDPAMRERARVYFDAALLGMARGSLFVPLQRPLAGSVLALIGVDLPRLPADPELRSILRSGR